MLIFTWETEVCIISNAIILSWWQIRFRHFACNLTFTQQISLWFCVNEFIWLLFVDLILTTLAFNTFSFLMHKSCWLSPLLITYLRCNIPTFNHSSFYSFKAVLLFLFQLHYVFDMLVACVDQLHSGIRFLLLISSHCCYSFIFLDLQLHLHVIFYPDEILFSVHAKLIWVWTCCLIKHTIFS